MVKAKNKIDKVVFQAVEYLQEYFAIKEVILFGSQLSGKATKFSDIDLAVISPDFQNKSFEDLANIFAKLSLLCNSSIEFHPYSLSDFKEARPTNFLGQILKTGKVIYRG